MKTRSEIQLAIHAAIHDVVATDYTLTPDTHMHDNLGMDSLDATALALSLEPVLDLEFSPEEEAKFGNMTIREITDHVEARYNGNQ